MLNAKEFEDIALSLSTELQKKKNEKNKKTNHKQCFIVSHMPAMAAVGSKHFIKTFMGLQRP